MDVQELLEEAKRASGSTTDKALAGRLKVKPTAVSNYSRGVSVPDPVVCGALSDITGIPLARVLGIVGEARAISREEKAIWKRLATAAVVALCAIGSVIPLNLQASVPESAYYVLALAAGASAWACGRLLQGVGLRPA